MTIQSIKRQIIPILKLEGVTKASIFGSFATGDETERSDVDLLVRFQGGASLLDLSRLKLKLEEKIGRKVDVLTYDSVHPYLKKIVLEEQKLIYEKKS